MIGRAANGTNVEFSRPFDALNDYWQLDTASGDFFNVQTKKPIHGRQDFPSLFEADFSFLALPVERLKDIPLILQGEQVLALNLNAMLLSKQHSRWHAQRDQQLHYIAETAAKRKV